MSLLSVPSDAADGVTVQGGSAGPREKQRALNQVAEGFLIIQITIFCLFTDLFSFHLGKICSLSSIQNRS